jgi:hypothetical protein
MFVVVAVVFVVDDDVESAEDPAILSPIDIMWCSSKSCWVVGTANRFDSRTMLWRVPMLD